MHHDFAPQAVTEQHLLRTFPTVGLSSMRDAGTTFFSFFMKREEIRGFRPARDARQ